MARRLIACTAILVIALAGLRAPTARAARGVFVPISSYDDDPFVTDSVVERLSRWAFGSEEDGALFLSNALVDLEDEPVVYRADPATGAFRPFAWNPWSPELRRSTPAGDFAFPDEARFPLHRVEREADGRVVLVGGLQNWLPQDLHRGMTTLFEAVHVAKESVELWSGRELAWGQQGRLYVNAHAFIDFNAFFSPSSRALFFGVLPYRLPGEGSAAPIKMFEVATAWEIAVHEAGHALYTELKPNRDFTDPGLKTWSESFGDQLAMWASLRDPERARALVAETNGDLAQSSSLSRVGEVFAALVGQGTALRDAFHDKKVSDTTPEVHDRSEVFTGAAYAFFASLHSSLRREHGAAEALAKAARILGTFLTRSADFTPENRMTLEDVAKAYLTVDRELFDGRYHAWLVDEFTRRELFDATSLSEWREHEAATPSLRLPRALSDAEVEAWLRAHLDALGIGPDFGLRLQSVRRVDRFRIALGPEPTLVRVQLTLGRGEGATPLDNHGILVFRANGTLADYQAPLPDAAPLRSQRGASRTQAQAQAQARIADARRLGLDRRGGRIAVVRGPGGELTAEVRVLRDEGLGAYMEVFSLDHPTGERREVVVPPVPPERRIHIHEDVLD